MTDFADFLSADNPLVGQVRDALKRKRTFRVDALADSLDVSPKRVRDAIDALRDIGFRIPTEVEGHVELNKVAPTSDEPHRLPLALLDGDRVRFAVVSDTHLCSKHCALPELNLAYDYFEREGIADVFHPGDLVAGLGIFPGQHNEITHHTFEDQVEYAQRCYPRRPGVTTHIIGGNHDLEGAFGRMGADPVRAVANQRDDFNYLGPYSAWVELINGGYIHLLHGKGGMSYAYCHSEDTEVLTDAGWKRFADLDRTERVATLNPATEQLEYQVPTDWIDQPYNGEMVQFGGGRTSSYDLLVTPNHRMWVRRPWDRKGRWVGGKPMFVEAASITQGRQWALARGCEWEGVTPETLSAPGLGPVDPVAYLQFLGWFIAEGSTNQANNQIVLAQQPGEGLDEIVRIVRRLGIEPGVYPGQTCHRVAFSNRELASFLKTLGRSHEKFVPQFIKELSRPLIDGFLSAYWRGDGCHYADGRMRHACTVSRQLADDLQELALKAGYPATVKASAGVTGNQVNGHAVLTARDRYVVSLSHKKRWPVIEKPPTREPYDGRVYCVTVPNGIVLTRRNGKAAWSGNSYRAQKIVDGYGQGRKPGALILGHYHVQGNFSPRSVNTMFPACFEWQSVQFGARLGLRPTVGFHVVEAQLGDDGSFVEWTPRWKPFFEGRVVSA